MKPFLHTLAEGPILFDGAMGSLLYDRGVLHTRSYDELVTAQPDLIARVHRDYIDAGAQVIETDTFGANRIALARHGLADQMATLNKAAVKLARECAAGRAYVAGAVGPTGVRFAIASESERRRARMALAEQIDTLVIAGVDLILLETFPSILELELAIAVAKERGPKVPVVAQHVFDLQCKGDGGLAPAEVAERLVNAGADVIGANCGVGPAELYTVATGMIGRGKPVIVQPNAGMPAAVEGRTIYVANPEHFGVFARRLLKSGVRAIGGCCGTTPAHIQAMLGAFRMLGGARLDDAPTPTQQVPSITSGAAAPRPAAVPLAERSRLGARIAKGEFAVSVEITAPAGTDLTKTKQQVATLLAAGVDIVNIADGPRASARMGNLAVCARLAAETAVEPILHVCTRDRNFLGLVAHLLGAQALGLRDLVIITGDPPKMGDYPFATPVYDVDSIGLLRMAAGLNAGVDPAGKPTAPTSFVLATGAEPGAADYDRELRRLEEKKAAGAELVMTQPVYDPRTLERFLDDTAGLGLPMMVGILPLASAKNAEFLHNEVPGMAIPADIRARMAKAGAGAEGRAEGLRIAQEALAAVKHKVAGVYIMPPFNRVEAAIAVLDVARDRWQPAVAP
ncbi:MAG: bifunctional homocysteine S-methyltransferase/methylenetetrahydrofolate reductase [Myxococcales bacterium]|nr:bifunctional homocysteine S-methyltransferase/methylenetetrahydrofolate reductase [Myxococcales bacterium]MBK7195754.1 bifunctional homocysteine S-methyltransferase/methylenetetrahydrofolate reductase [Myxococcales bacterium]MBP6844389.1 bifunctional homocysteine S-methyltransferase/methylenetetrahydrofolate reductase [Kofleriaceae bacterium]